MPSYQYDGTKWILATGGGTVTSVATTGSITGGTITTTGTLQLVNDATSPGNSKYYGTDSGGTKGFFTLPGAITPAALTKTDDTNVTLTLGGTPATALLQATSLTLGWTGTLGVSRGGTGTGTAFTQGSVIFAGASGIYTQDNANLFFDDTNNRLGIGNAAPTSSLDITTNSLGTTQTQTSGLALVNNTAAAAGAQQISPALRFLGRGWKTNATAASQTLEFRAYVLPVQGTANPTGSLKIERSINGGAYAETIRFGETGQIYCAGSAGIAGYYLSSGGSGATAIWSALPTPPVVTSSDSSLTVSGTYDAIINVGHTNYWNIFQGNIETSHTAATSGEVWNDRDQHAMAFSIAGTSPDSPIQQWFNGTYYSCWNTVTTITSTEYELLYPTP